MLDQFIFFCVNVGNENLLKEEIKKFYPELTLSYSRKGFLTFKNKGKQYDFDTISELAITFATRVGICLGKAKPDEVRIAVLDKMDELNMSIDKFVIHNYSVNTDFQYDAGHDFDISINEYSSEGKMVLNLIALGEKEVWFGVHKVIKGITRFPNSKVEVEVPQSAPSIGFRKFAEIVELYALKFSGRDSWLDIGCAPGGSSAYLLSKGCRVWGVDTANKVDPTVLSHKNFHFIQSSVQDLSHEDMPENNIHWVHSDLNLNPKQAIKEVLRLCKKYNKSLKGVVFTVQVVKMEYIECIEEFDDIFYDWGFSLIFSRQVPSHKKEYALIAQRRIRY